MLTDYIEAAMRHAEYEDLGEEGWYGRIPGFDGLWANASSREDTIAELRSTLEDWLILGLRHGDLLPVVDGIDLNERGIAAMQSDLESRRFDEILDVTFAEKPMTEEERAFAEKALYG